MQMNQTMHSPVTTALAQTIYNLSDSDFNRLLNQSTYLKQLGNLCSIGIYLISIGCAIACFQAYRYGGPLAALGVILVGILAAFYTYSLSHILKKQRTDSAATTIKIFTILNMLTHGIGGIFVFCEAATNRMMLIPAAVQLILFIIFLIVFNASRNQLLFNDGALTHEQIKYINSQRNGLAELNIAGLPISRFSNAEKTGFNVAGMPTGRRPQKNDDLFRIYAITGSILIFAAELLSFITQNIDTEEKYSLETLLQINSNNERKLAKDEYDRIITELKTRNENLAKVLATYDTVKGAIALAMLTNSTPQENINKLHSQLKEFELAVEQEQAALSRLNARKEELRLRYNF